MALVLADRVKETTTSTGTTAITLAGAATGYQTFSSAVGDTNTTYYTIADQTGANWEVGIGTYTTSGNTLSRDTVLASSNAGSLVTFTSGTKDVFVTYPAERALYTGGPLGTPSSGTLTNCTFPTLNQNTTGTAATATNLASGSVGTIPYQSASGTTAMLAVGTTGQVLTSNGTSAPTWTTPAASSGAITAVATGSLPNGSPVIINSDGTVSVVGQTVSPQALGTEVIFSSGNTNRISSAYDSVNGKVVITYQGSGTSGAQVIVGTVSGMSISFGTPVVFGAGIYPQVTNTVYDSTNSKIVIVYQNASTLVVSSIVGTVSGTAITLGTGVVIKTLTSSISYLSAVYAGNGKVVVSFRDNTNAFKGTSYVGTVSGTSISFGTAVIFDTSASADGAVTSCYDSTNGKVVIAYLYNGVSGYAIVGTVSGTSISFGTAVVFASGVLVYYTSACYDSTNGKVVIAYQGTSSAGTAIVGTVSGTSISFGTAVVFASGNINEISARYDSTNGKVNIVYFNSNASYYGSVIVGTVSGTSISFGTAVIFNSANTTRLFATYDVIHNKVVISYFSTDGKSIIFANATPVSNLTSTNFIGFSSSSYTNGQTATINTVGSTNTGQTGMTAANAYYVQLNGTIGLTPASPSVYAGLSLSSTEILIKG